VHVVAALLTAPVPTPISATEPASQALQSALDVPEYVPEPHAVHVAAPLLTAPVPAPISATDPASHAAHSTTSGGQKSPIRSSFGW
jgi:hypothetical protein